MLQYEREDEYSHRAWRVTVRRFFLPSRYIYPRKPTHNSESLEEALEGALEEALKHKLLLRQADRYSPGTCTVGRPA